MIATIVGTRPQFIKIDKEIPQVIINSGQHYDYEMSEVFFKGMKLPKPDYNLGCKGNEVGRMVDSITRLLKKLKPSLVIVYGDCHTTLAGALAATYLNIPVAHIEAGLRCGRMDMPEEINRVLTDKLATYRFCPNEEAENNLHQENIHENVFVVGDVLFDSMNPFFPIKKTKDANKYVLLTIHRAENTDKTRLKEILEAMTEYGKPVIFPVHPRTKKAMKGMTIGKNIKVIKPVGYREMLSLEANAKHIVTDSGGVQREGYWLQKPMTIVRRETEWPEIINTGWGILATSKEMILKSLEESNRLFKEQPVFEYGTKKLIRTILDRYV